MTPVYHFFGGKGGVGKTTCAAAAAVAASEAGRRVLLVSTDPAHSLADALDVRLGPRPVRVPIGRHSLRGRRAVRGVLEGLELDADRALARWIGKRRRAFVTIGERGTYLDADDIERFLRLSLPGVDELIGLIELARVARAAPRDEVIVDTAPTGHTLRLLATPATLRRIATVLSDMQAKHRFLSESLGRGYRRDFTDALIDELDAEGRQLAELLADAGRCTFSWVVLPELLTLAEARDGVAALDAAGITVNDIVVNGVTPVLDAACRTCLARAHAEADAIGTIRATFPGRCLRFVRALPDEPRGVRALRRIHGAGAETPPKVPALGAVPASHDRLGPMRTPAAAGEPWLSVIAPPGRRLVLFGGKGGVGKTTCASAAALALAAREPGRRLLLLSTDPAPSLSDVLDLEIGDRECRIPRVPGHLVARELDADRAFAARRDRYREAVDELFNALLGGSRFDIAFDRVVVRELIDLAPPGLDELFGVLTVIEALRPRGSDDSGAGHDLVVVDTAPTGHTLRLLRMPETALQWVHALLAILLKYRKVIGLGDLAADLVEVARDLRELAALLRDPERTGFVAVTRAAELPRLETGRLLARLTDLGIHVPALVVNRVTSGACARCAAAARRERRVTTALGTALPERCAMIVAPALPVPPRGADALTRWGRAWTISQP